MSETYFDLSKDYVDLLKSEGLYSLADQLSEIIEGSATANELLMGVQFTLTKVPLDNLSAEHRRKVEKYLQKLAKLLV